MLHHCIEGVKVVVDGSQIVDVDPRHDPCLGGTPAPPGERGREPPLQKKYTIIPTKITINP